MPIQVTSLLPCLHMHDYCGSERERGRGVAPSPSLSLSSKIFSLFSYLFLHYIYEPCCAPWTLTPTNTKNTLSCFSPFYCQFKKKYSSRPRTFVLLPKGDPFRNKRGPPLSLSLSVLSLSFLYSFTKEVRQMPCTWLCGFLVNLGDNFWFVISCFLPTNQNLYNSRTYMERNASFLPVLSLSLSDSFLLF